MDIAAIQRALREEKIDGWLLTDFRNRDYLAYRLLGLNAEKMSSRRWYYYIPARGEPKKIVSAVERQKLDALPGKQYVYLSWKEQHAAITRALGPRRRIAMQYSPKNNVPYISLVDGGTIELLRSLGYRIVSSADLVQMFVSLISEEGYRTHKEAAAVMDRIMEEAFAMIRTGAATGSGVTELDVQQEIMKRFTEENLETYDPPMVGTNDHPADPHFELTPERSRPFARGDTVLIDMWAKKKVPGAIYYDITWVGFVGEQPPEDYVRMYMAVRDARDAAVNFVMEKFARKQPCYGWQVDDRGNARERRQYRQPGNQRRPGPAAGVLLLHRAGHLSGRQDGSPDGNQHVYQARRNTRGDRPCAVRHRSALTGRRRGIRRSRS